MHSMSTLVQGLEKAACELLFFNLLLDLHGSFCVLFSGMVFKGTWNKLPVALKVLTNDGGISPTSAVRLHKLS